MTFFFILSTKVSKQIKRTLLANFPNLLFANFPSKSLSEFARKYHSRYVSHSAGNRISLEVLLTAKLQVFCFPQNKYFFCC